RGRVRVQADEEVRAGGVGDADPLAQAEVPVVVAGQGHRDAGRLQAPRDRARDGEREPLLVEPLDDAGRARVRAAVARVEHDLRHGEKTEEHPHGPTLAPPPKRATNRRSDPTRRARYWFGPG